MKIEAVDFFYLSMPEVLDIGDGSQDACLARVQTRAGTWHSNSGVGLPILKTEPIPAAAERRKEQEFSEACTEQCDRPGGPGRVAIPSGCDPLVARLRLRGAPDSAIEAGAEQSQDTHGFPPAGKP